MVRLLAFSGSARSGSFNQRLVALAARRAEAEGAQVELIQLGDLHLPLFNEDFEKDPGTPEEVSQLRHQMMEHDG